MRLGAESQDRDSAQPVPEERELNQITDAYKSGCWIRMVRWRGGRMESVERRATKSVERRATKSVEHRATKSVEHRAELTIPLEDVGNLVAKQLAATIMEDSRARGLLDALANFVPETPESYPLCLLIFTRDPIEATARKGAVSPPGAKDSRDKADAGSKYVNVRVGYSGPSGEVQIDDSHITGTGGTGHATGSFNVDFGAIGEFFSNLFSGGGSSGSGGSGGGFGTLTTVDGGTPTGGKQNQRDGGTAKKPN
jgi:hypothetical protein